MKNSLIMHDAMQDSLSMANRLKGESGWVGYGTIALFDGDGVLKHIDPFANTITDAGDLYYAKQAIVGVSPAGATAPTLVNGMKVGTGGATAVNKPAGTGIAIVTYPTGITARGPFAASYPQTANLGTNAGVNVVYQTTWAAGSATNGALSEAVIVNDQATDASSSAANTISRVTFGAIAKNSSDTLTITWNHKMLGA